MMNPNCQNCQNCQNWNVGRLVHQKTPFKWIGAYRIQLKKGGTGKTVPAIDVYGKSGKDIHDYPKKDKLHSDATVWQTL